MNRDRVLVPMSRYEADFVRLLLAGAITNTARRVKDRVTDALDTDREQQVERVARAIEGFAADGIDIGWDRCGSARQELARLAARRVLSVLEGEDDE